MKRFVYWLCFTLVAIPTTYSLVAWPLSLFGLSLPAPPFLSLFFSFGSLVPQMLAPLVPRPILVVLGLAMMFLILRRAYLFAFKKERVPHSFRGFQKVLGYVGASFFVLASVVLILSIALRAGSGVPAGMLLLPAMLCVPWAFFLTEVLSFRKEAPLREA
jgi:hypothetical protein